MPIRLPSVAALVLSAAVAVPTAAVAGPLTPGERQRLIAHLQMTEDWLVGELEELSDAQLTFKMTPESWSIKDVAEHLAIAEPQYWTNLEASMKEPVKSGWKPEATDEQMLWYGIDRTNRTTTGEARVPTGKVKDVREPLDKFLKLRATMREYATKTTDDLRSRKLLEGNMDVYQWFLMISTHSQRHILQIREIKADPKYPS